MEMSREFAVARAAPVFLPNPAVSGDHPDREILDLGRRYFELVAAEAAADEAYERACDSVQEVERPSALRHRMEDHIFDFGCFNLHFDERTRPHGGFSADASLNAFYTPKEIRLLPYSPPPFDLDMIPAQKARIEEIEQAWRAHLDRFHAAEEAAGINTAEEAIDQIAVMKRAIVEEIAAAQATTLAGLQVKARILAEADCNRSDEEAPTEELITAAIVRDLLAMAA